MTQQSSNDMSKRSLVIGKLISILFFSVMSGLLLYVAVDEGFEIIFILAIDALALVSIPATYLLCAWVGYRSIQVYSSEVVSSVNKWHFLLQNITPFLAAPILALVSGGLILYLHGSELGYGKIVWGILFVLPVISFFVGLGVSVFVSIFKK